MGSAIAKIAFQPPDPAYARSTIPRKREHVTILNEVNGTEISLLYFPHKGAKYTVLFSHGNAEDLGHGYDYFKQFGALIGVNLLTYDYSGYGCSEGVCSETNAYSDISSVLSYITGSLHVPKERVILCGRSLGSGPSTNLASEQRGLAGLILISALTSAAAVAGSTASFLLYPCDIFANIRKIPLVTDYPIIILHGSADEVVPYVHGQKLYAAAKKVNQRVQFVPLEGCGHNNIEELRGDQFFSVLKSFIASL